MIALKKNDRTFIIIILVFISILSLLFSLFICWRKYENRMFCFFFCLLENMWCHFQAPMTNAFHPFFFFLRANAEEFLLTAIVPIVFLQKRADITVKLFSIVLSSSGLTEDLIPRPDNSCLWYARMLIWLHSEVFLAASLTLLKTTFYFHCIFSYFFFFFFFFKFY